MQIFRKRYSTISVALTASTGQIIVELFLVVLHIPTLIVAAVATPFAGVFLLVIYRFGMKQKLSMLPTEWKNLVMVSVLFAITEFTWYDSVSRIGAGKTTLINMPLEIVCVIIFAFLILNERLTRSQIIGVGIVVSGIILSVVVVDITPQFGVGEIEAVIASLSGAIQIVFVTKLLFRYNTIECTAVTLLFSGIMLNLAWIFNPVTIEPIGWSLLLLYPVVPMLLFWLFFLSMNKIGPSLTSIISSSSIMITLITQLILIRFAIPVTLPENIVFAFMGGLVSTVGVCVIFGKDR